MRKLVFGCCFLVLLGLATLAVGYQNALRDPVVRTAKIAVPNWPAGMPPMRVLALADVHVAGPDMPPERLRRIAEKLNRLQPDLVLIAGDLVSEKRSATQLYEAGEIMAALAGFKAPLGTVIAPGNHDHWAGLPPFLAAAARHGIAMPQNFAVTRGPFAIAVIDDDYSGHADPETTLEALDDLAPGVPLLVTHSPDVIPQLGREFAAIFAGHTHCGQISLPVIGPLATMSRYGRRFACGDIDDPAGRIFVSAGLGTSLLPLRYGAPPDVWLVTFGPDD